MKSRLFVLAVAAFVALSASSAAAAQPLRVCADPDYLPYSNRAGQGFENKIASIVAHALHRPLAYVWASIRGESGFDEMVHNQLDAGKCDLVVDVPYAAPNMKTTRPYYISSYVFVYKKSANFTLDSLDAPALRKLRIGYEADTPAEAGLKLRALTVGAKPFLSADEESASPSQIVDAVESNRINVGITWDPAIGYFVGRHADLTTAVIPNSRSQGSPEQYSFPMSMATSEGNTQLSDALNRVIAGHRPELEAVLRAYNIRFFQAGAPT